jgi:hypothetical protein
MSVNALVSQTIENQQATRQDFPCYCSFAYSPLTPYQAKRQRFYRLFIMVASVSRNPSLFPSPIYVSDLGVVTFEHLLDALDRAVQLTDQIFIGSGEQIGKKSVNLLSNLSILLATSPYLKQIFPIYRIADGDAHSHEESTQTLKEPMGSVAELRHKQIHIQAHKPSARSPERGCG